MLAPFRLLYFEGPRPHAGALRAAQAGGLVRGRAPPTRIRAPASWIHGCCCRRQLWAAPGQVAGRPQTPLEEGPQRMRGAERSLVTVGRSFTVAKGLVPLWGERSERGLQLAVGPGKAPGHLSCVHPASCPRHPHSPLPCLPLPSPVPAGPVLPQTHRGKSSGGCCSQDMSFCRGGREEGPSLEGKGPASSCPSLSPSRRQRPPSARLWACSPRVLRPRILWVSDLRSLRARGPSPGQDGGGLMGSHSLCLPRPGSDPGPWCVLPGRQGGQAFPSAPGRAPGALVADMNTSPSPPRHQKLIPPLPALTGRLRPGGGGLCQTQ